MDRRRVLAARLTTAASRPGYRDLLEVPGFPRAIAGTAVQRTGSQMLQVAMVLFVLVKFRSPALAGITVFLQIFPGLLISPLAGALLDRYGRVRLMLLDFMVSALTLALIAYLSLSGRLSTPVLLLLVAINSLTSIMTVTGLRSLWPIIVPRTLWDRANGLDSGLYAVTTVIGPPLAAGMVALRGGEAALLVTAACFVAAAVIMAGIHEPRTGEEERGTIWREAWEGLRYVARNRTLRGLALSISLVNLGTGGLVVSLPVLVLTRLHAGPATVGWVFGVFGIAALLSALVFGRIGSVGRERAFLTGSMLVTVVAFVILAFAQNLALVYGAAALEGTFIGAGDIGLFSIRQRRTDPAWFGRAFAVSMSLNYMGAPFGSAISGALVSRSIALAFLVGAAFNLAAAASTVVMIPAAAE